MNPRYCTICGALLPAPGDNATVFCPYCGTRHTLPSPANTSPTLPAPDPEAAYSPAQAEFDPVYTRAVNEVENALCYEISKDYARAISAYRTAMELFLSIPRYKDCENQAKDCSLSIARIQLATYAMLTIRVRDSLNPLALANGTHYVYRILDANGNLVQSIDLILKKGTTSATVQLEPGEYTVTLNVYGWNDSPAVSKPLHTRSQAIRLEPSSKWTCISNRPGLFSGLQMDVHRS